MAFLTHILPKPEGDRHSIPSKYALQTYYSYQTKDTHYIYPAVSALDISNPYPHPVLGFGRFGGF